MARFKRSEVFFRLKRGHAAGAGGGHRLPINLVLHIAGSEDTWDGSARAARREGTED